VGESSLVRSRWFRVALILAAMLAAPAAARAAPTHLYVSNYESAGAITPFTIGGGGLLDRRARKLTGHGDPWFLAMTPDGKHLYATNNALDEATVSQFNVAANGTLTPMSPAAVTVGELPQAMAVSPNGRNAYVANWGDGTLSVLSIGAGGQLTPKATVDANLAEAAGVALTPDGKSLYVANWDSNNVAQFRVLSDGSLTPMAKATVAAGQEPDFIAVTPNGKHAYVTNYEDGTVSEYAVGAGGALLLLGHVTAGAAESNMYSATIRPNGSAIYVPTGSGVHEFGIGANGLLSSKGTAAAKGSDPENIWLTADGKSAYLADYASGQQGVLAQYNVSAAGLLAPKSPATIAANGGPAAVMIPPDQAPHAVARATVAAAGSPTVFDASKSTDSDGRVVRHRWTFGDGTTASTAGPSVRHVYRAGGTFVVTVTETDDSGCSTRLVYTGQTAYCNGSPQAVGIERIPVPPNTRITAATIHPKKHSASFSFAAVGQASGFECSLQKTPKRHHKPLKLAFKPCKSPKTYGHLNAGTYTFRVRAFSSGGADNTAAKRTFKIHR
jgi:DNA-binding beta-propeller fold protein YncE